MKTQSLRTIFIILFATFICAGCFIAVPVGPGGVPIIMQNMIAVLASVILGGFGGLFSVLIFITAGALGLPVYSGATGGVAHLLGPTGGFIIGYIFAALAAGLISGVPSVSEKSFSRRSVLKLTLASLAGFAVLYIPGVLWFMHVTGKPFGATMAACVVPFIPGDIIKLVLTVLIAAKLRPVSARYLSSQS